MCGIENQNIAVGTETAITKQVSRVGQREERLADAERRVVFAGDLRVGLKIERITHILEPSESVRRQRLRRADCRFRRVAVHSVYREIVSTGQQRENSLDSFEVLGKRTGADFDLHMRVSVIQE